MIVEEVCGRGHILAGDLLEQRVNGQVRRDLALGDHFKRHPAFAIHAKHVHEMLSSMFPSPAPLVDFRKEPARTVEFEKSTVADFQKKFSAAAATGWMVRSGREADDYEAICDFAHAFAFTQLLLVQAADAPGDAELSDTHAGTKAQWQVETNRVLAALGKVPWNIDQMKSVNAFAANHKLQRMSGTFVFGVVDEVFQKQGKSLLKIRFKDVKGTILVPVLSKAKASSLPKGNECLVLGLVIDFVDLGDNPLEQEEVPIVIAPLLMSMQARKTK